MPATLQVETLGTGPRRIVVAGGFMRRRNGIDDRSPGDLSLATPVWSVFHGALRANFGFAFSIVTGVVSVT